MFKNEFQGGAYFEVFSAQGKDPTANWKLTGPGIKKSFDKEVKSFVFALEGTSTTKMQLPKDLKHSLALVQRYLVLQVNVPKGHDFCIDLGVTDLHNNKRRLALSTTYKDIQTNPLHCKIPLGLLHRHGWLNLCVDLVSLVGETWRGQTYKSVENICISANCKLRRIFTMRAQLADGTADDEIFGISSTNDTELDSIPKQCQLAPDITQMTQVINMKKIRLYEGKGKQPDILHSSTEFDLNSSGGRRAMQDEYHIAFGTKMAGSGQPRKSSAGKEGNVTSRLQKSAHSRSKSDASTDGMLSSRGAHVLEQQRRQTADRKTADSYAGGNGPDRPADTGYTRSYRNAGSGDGKEDMPFVQPHPPREPSSDRVRRKPRVKSAGHRTSHGDSSNASSRVSSAGSSSLVSNSSSCQSNPGQPPTDIDVDCYMNACDDSISELIDTLKYQASPPHAAAAAAGDDAELTDTLKAVGTPDAEDGRGRYTNGDIERISHERIYTFSSPPKCVQLRANGTDGAVRPRVKTKASHYESSSGRCDFTDDSLGDGASERAPGSPPPVVTDTDSSGGRLTAADCRSPAMSQSRMSISKKSLREITKEQLQQSVNLKPYHSSKYELADLSDSFEARMLETLRQQALDGTSDSSDDGGGGGTARRGMASPSRYKYATDIASNSSDDDTSVGAAQRMDSRKPSAHNYQDEMKSFNSDFLAQSNPREWGSVFSPPIVLPSAITNNSNTQLTKRTSLDVPHSKDIRGVGGVGDVKETGSDEEDELDLLYDRVLNCFYDPKTCKYYELT